MNIILHLVRLVGFIAFKIGTNSPFTIVCICYRQRQFVQRPNRWKKKKPSPHSQHGKKYFVFGNCSIGFSHVLLKYFYVSTISFIRNKGDSCGIRMCIHSTLVFSRASLFMNDKIPSLQMKNKTNKKINLNSHVLFRNMR